MFFLNLKSSLMLHGMVWCVSFPVAGLRGHIHNPKTHGNGIWHPNVLFEVCIWSVLPFQTHHPLWTQDDNVILSMISAYNFDFVLHFNRRRHSWNESLHRFSRRTVDRIVKGTAFAANMWAIHELFVELIRCLSVWHFIVLAYQNFLSFDVSYVW